MQDTETIIAPLINMLNGLKPISADLHQLLVRSFKTDHVKKGAMLLHEGNICRNIWFLSSGLLRSYHNIGEKGDHIQNYVHRAYCNFCRQLFYANTRYRIRRGIGR
jgi:hypothetical protein